MFSPELSIITPEGEGGTGIKSQVFDFWATSDAENLFRKISRWHFKRYLCGEKTSCMLKGNLLLVGGPGANSITRDILERIPVRYKFNDDAIIDITNVNFYRKPDIKDNNLSKDYGVITKCYNPYNEKKYVIIAMGCYGWGTWASLKATLDPAIVKFLTKKNADLYQVLVSIEVYDKMPGEPKLEKDTFVVLKKSETRKEGVEVTK